MTNFSGIGLPLSDPCNQKMLPHHMNSAVRISEHRTPHTYPVSIFWDIENCSIPGDVNPDDVAGNILTALRFHHAVKGSVTMFSAYGDFNHFPRKLREGCQRTGVNLIDVPNVKKDASDKAIIVDMFLFALDNPPPCSILLISGDVDFAPALHKLGQRGYTMLLAIPSGVAVLPAFCNAGRFVWHWPSLARGDGLVPAKQFLNRPAEDKTTEHAVVTGQDSENEFSYPQHVNTSYPFQQSNFIYGGAVPGKFTVKQESGEALIVDHHVIPAVGQSSGHLPENLARAYGSNFCSSLQSSGCPNSNSASNCIDRKNGNLPLPVKKGSTRSDELWIRPGDLQGLKLQLIQLLRANNGILHLLRVPSLYSKRFGRPLYLSEYGSPKLVHLFERMPDAFFIEGQGNNKCVCLKDTKEAQSKGDAMRSQNVTDKDLQEDFVSTQSNEQTCSDEKASKSEEDEEQIVLQQPADGEMSDGESDLAISLEVLKLELQELLVSHACMIPFSRLQYLYKQRYAHELDATSFGFEDLECLLENMSDVITVKMDPVTSKKILVAKRDL